LFINRTEATPRIDNVNSGSKALHATRCDHPPSCLSRDFGENKKFMTCPPFSSNFVHHSRAYLARGCKVPVGPGNKPDVCQQSIRCHSPPYRTRVATLTAEEAVRCRELQYKSASNFRICRSFSKTRCTHNPRSALLQSVPVVTDASNKAFAFVRYHAGSGYSSRKLKPKICRKQPSGWMQDTVASKSPEPALTVRPPKMVIQLKLDIW
jgi:hypothetical protein